MTKLIYDATLNDELPEPDNIMLDNMKKCQENYHNSVEELIKAICSHEKCSPVELQMNVQYTEHGQKIWFTKKD